MTVTSVPQAVNDSTIPVTPDNLRARALAEYRAVEERRAAEQRDEEATHRAAATERLRLALIDAGLGTYAPDAPEFPIDGVFFRMSHWDYSARLQAGLPCRWCGEPVYEECYGLFSVGLLLQRVDDPPEHPWCMRERAARERPTPPAPEPAPLDVRDFLADAIKALVVEVLDERAGAGGD